MNSRPWLSDSRFAYSMMRVSANLSGSLISNIPQITESAASCRSAVKSDASGDIRHGERDIAVTRRGAHEVSTGLVVAIAHRLRALQITWS